MKLQILLLPNRIFISALNISAIKPDEGQLLLLRKITLRKFIGANDSPSTSRKVDHFHNSNSARVLLYGLNAYRLNWHNSCYFNSLPQIMTCLLLILIICCCLLVLWPKFPWQSLHINVDNLSGNYLQSYVNCLWLVTCGIRKLHICWYVILAFDYLFYMFIIKTNATYLSIISDYYHMSNQWPGKKNNNFVQKICSKVCISLHNKDILNNKTNKMYLLFAL